MWFKSFFEKRPNLFVVYSLVKLYIFYLVQIKFLNILAYLTPSQLKAYNKSQREMDSWWDHKLKVWGGYYEKVGWPFAIDIHDENWKDKSSIEESPSERKLIENRREQIERTKGLWLYNAWKNVSGKTDTIVKITSIFTVLALAVEYTIDYLSLVSDSKGAGNYVKDLEDIGFNIISVMVLGWIILMLYINLPILGTLYRYLCDALLVILTCAILYGIAVDFVPNLDPENPSWITFILSSLFYLPCLLHDAIQTKFDASVGQTLVILILFEILVLYLKFMPNKLNPLITSISNESDSVVLQKNPIYIDKATDVTDLKGMYGSQSTNPNYHFAISLDIWINPQPISTAPSYSEDANILNMDGRPSVTYNSAQRALKVTFVNEKAQNEVMFVTNKVELQTWNNLVINFDGGTLDVFLNGNLVSSHPEITPYFTKAAVVLGERNGIAGGIKNVVYYRYTLDPQQIKANALL